MLRYGFFDSEIIGYDEEDMPIFDRAESSDFLAMFISKIITDGVLGAPGDCFQVIAYSDMTVKVRPGFGIVKGRFAMDLEETELKISVAPEKYKRIDRVILRANYIDRLCEIIVREGEPAEKPVPPELIRPLFGDYYELCLATVTIESKQTTISQSNIKDTRYDSQVCGVVTQAIDHLDTSVFFAQLEQFYKEFVERSDGSYDQFVADMEAYLGGLKESGDGQLEVIVKSLIKFEADSEEQWDEWFDGIKQTLASVENGELLNQIYKLIKDTYDIATPEDITAIINGTYVDDGNNESILFEPCTPEDITAIIDGTYKESEIQEVA